MTGRLSRLGNRWAFLGATAIIYIVAGLLSPGLAAESLWAFVRIVVNIIPIFLLVFGMMFLANIYLTGKKIARHLGKESGVKGWLFAIGGGILSSGPIYVWYPLLGDLRKKGVRDSLIAAFLYNRAVKIPLLPLMIFYFGWAFTIMLTFLMIVFSILNGLLVERLEGVNG